MFGAYGISRRRSSSGPQLSNADRNANAREGGDEGLTADQDQGYYKCPLRQFYEVLLNAQVPNVDVLDAVVIDVDGAPDGLFTSAANTGTSTSAHSTVLRRAAGDDDSSTVRGEKMLKLTPHWPVVDAGRGRESQSQKLKLFSGRRESTQAARQREVLSFFSTNTVMGKGRLSSIRSPMLKNKERSFSANVDDSFGVGITSTEASNLVALHVSLVDGGVTAEEDLLSIGNRTEGGQGDFVEASDDTTARKTIADRLRERREAKRSADPRGEDSVEYAVRTIPLDQHSIRDAVMGQALPEGLLLKYRRPSSGHHNLVRIIFTPYLTRVEKHKTVALLDDERSSLKVRIATSISPSVPQGNTSDGAADGRGAGYVRASSHPTSNACVVPVSPLLSSSCATLCDNIYKALLRRGVLMRLAVLYCMEVDEEAGGLVFLWPGKLELRPASEAEMKDTNRNSELTMGTTSNCRASSCGGVEGGQKLDGGAQSKWSSPELRPNDKTKDPEAPRDKNAFAGNQNKEPTRAPPSTPPPSPLPVGLDSGENEVTESERRSREERSFVESLLENKVDTFGYFAVSQGAGLLPFTKDLAFPSLELRREVRLFAEIRLSCPSDEMATLIAHPFAPSRAIRRLVNGEGESQHLRMGKSGLLTSDAGVSKNATTNLNQAEDGGGRVFVNELTDDEGPRTSDTSCYLLDAPYDATKFIQALCRPRSRSTQAYLTSEAQRHAKSRSTGRSRSHSRRKSGGSVGRDASEIGMVDISPIRRTIDQTARGPSEETADYEGEKEQDEHPCDDGQGDQNASRTEECAHEGDRSSSVSRPLVVDGVYTQMLDNSGVEKRCTSALAVGLSAVTAKQYAPTSQLWSAQSRRMSALRRRYGKGDEKAQKSIARAEAIVTEESHQRSRLEVSAVAAHMLAECDMLLSPALHTCKSKKKGPSSHNNTRRASSASRTSFSSSTLPAGDNNSAAAARFEVSPASDAYCGIHPHPWHGCSHIDYHTKTLFRPNTSTCRPSSAHKYEALVEEHRRGKLHKKTVEENAGQDSCVAGVSDGSLMHYLVGCEDFQKKEEEEGGRCVLKGTRSFEEDFSAHDFRCSSSLSRPNSATPSQSVWRRGADFDNGGAHSQPFAKGGKRRIPPPPIVEFTNTYRSLSEELVRANKKDIVRALIENRSRASNQAPSKPERSGADAAARKDIGYDRSSPLAADLNLPPPSSGSFPFARTDPLSNEERNWIDHGKPRRLAPLETRGGPQSAPPTCSRTSASPTKGNNSRSRHNVRYRMMMPPAGRISALELLFGPYDYKMSDEHKRDLARRKASELAAKEERRKAEEDLLGLEYNGCVSNESSAHEERIAVNERHHLAARVDRRASEMDYYSEIPEDDENENADDKSQHEGHFDGELGDAFGEGANPFESSVTSGTDDGAFTRCGTALRGGQTVGSTTASLSASTSAFAPPRPVHVAVPPARYSAAWARQYALRLQSTVEDLIYQERCAMTAAAKVRGRGKAGSGFDSSLIAGADPAVLVSDLHTFLSERRETKLQKMKDQRKTAQRSSARFSGSKASTDDPLSRRGGSETNKNEVEGPDGNVSSKMSEEQDNSFSRQATDEHEENDEPVEEEGAEDSTEGMSPEQLMASYNAKRAADQKRKKEDDDSHFGPSARRSSASPRDHLNASAKSSPRLSDSPLHDELGGDKSSACLKALSSLFIIPRPPSIAKEWDIACREGTGKENACRTVSAAEMEEDEAFRDVRALLRAVGFRKCEPADLFPTRILSSVAEWIEHEKARAQKLKSDTLKAETKLHAGDPLVAGDGHGVVREGSNSNSPPSATMTSILKQGVKTNSGKTAATAARPSTGSKKRQGLGSEDHIPPDLLPLTLEGNVVNVTRASVGLQRFLQIVLEVYYSHNSEVGQEQKVRDEDATRDNCFESQRRARVKNQIVDLCEKEGYCFVDALLASARPAQQGRL